MQSSFDDVFSQSLKEVKLDKNLIGYILPIKVGAYPAPSRIIWQDQNNIYIIGKKSGNTKQLIESANSLINAK